MSKYKPYQTKQKQEPQIDNERYQKALEYIRSLELDYWVALSKDPLDFIKSIEMRLWLNEGINVIIIDNGIKVLAR